MLACLRACLLACLLACVLACLRACLHACLLACSAHAPCLRVCSVLRAPCLRVCSVLRAPCSVLACVLVCVFACLRACLHACGVTPCYVLRPCMHARSVICAPSVGTCGNLWELMGTCGIFMHVSCAAMYFFTVCQSRMCREPIYSMKRTPVTIYIIIFNTNIHNNVHGEYLIYSCFYNVHKVFQKFNLQYSQCTNKAS